MGQRGRSPLSHFQSRQDFRVVSTAAGTIPPWPAFLGRIRPLPAGFGALGMLGMGFSCRDLDRCAARAPPVSRIGAHTARGSLASQARIAPRIGMRDGPRRTRGGPGSGSNPRGAGGTMGYIPVVQAVHDPHRRRRVDAQAHGRNQLNRERAKG